MKVLYVGHATLWVEVGGITILTDPWLQGLAGGRYVHDPELVTPLDDIRSPDVIVLSHAHPDHFNIPSLELLDRDAQVIVPKHFGKTLSGPDVDGLDIGWRNPDLEQELRQLGFTRVTPVSVGEQVQLAGGVRIVPVPSHQHRFPEMGMVITGPGGTLYNAVDTWPGEDALGDVAALQPDIVFLPFRFYLPPNL
jgi:L-ascorbate metabolism protein UlaG (beta-lactamase superfamily)